MTAFAIVLAVLGLGAPAQAGDATSGAGATQPAASTSSAAVTVTPTEEPAPRPRPRGLSEGAYRYWTRPLNPSARHLDHGVIEVGIAGGYPHRYRLEAAVGLFDHLSLGVTAHWLPGQSRPQVSPRIAVAFWRWRTFEVGALHFWSMYPPPERDVDPATDSFQRTAKWILGSATFAQRFVSAGVDAGVVAARVQDPGVEPAVDNAFITRWRFGGGLHLRAGTRRWGFTAQAHVPYLTAEILFDVRFGAFELRPRGGWRPREELRAIDRRMPARSPEH